MRGVITDGGGVVGGWNLGVVPGVYIGGPDLICNWGWRVWGPWPGGIWEATFHLQ